MSSETRPIKATPDSITSDEEYLSMTPVSDGDDVSMTSSTQNESKKVNHSTLVEGDPPEGKTTAVVAVMRGNSKHGYHRHRSNKRYKKQIVWVLLDNSSDGGLVFVKQRQSGWGFLNLNIFECVSVTRCKRFSRHSKFSETNILESIVDQKVAVRSATTIH